MAGLLADLTSEAQVAVVGVAELVDEVADVVHVGAAFGGFADDLVVSLTKNGDDGKDQEQESGNEALHGCCCVA